ncbi:MAG TPA: tetratricopeptide repeat protein [Terriglobales bacterium]|nr:tetratricopeptide repeat protein [Terriglobales bacterium]
MHVRRFAVLLSLFAIAPLLTAQSVSVNDPANAVDAGAFGGSHHEIGNFTTLSGSLTSMDGSPIPNCEIQLRSSSTGRVLATGFTAVNGSFEFTQVPIGEYEVVADKGVNHASNSVHLLQGLNTVSLRMSTPGQENTTGGDTVSVTALRVPDKARELFQKAQAAFQKERLADSWKLAEKALIVAPSYSEALTLRGILRIAKGDKTGGAQDLQASIKSDSNYPLAYFAMGALQNLQGQFAEAQRTLEQGLRVQPTAWQGYFELSKAMLGQSDYRAALKNIVRVEGMGAKYPPVYLVKAHALMGLKFYGDAATAFEHFLQLDPGGPNSADARKSLEAAKSFAETAQN